VHEALSSPASVSGLNLLVHEALSSPASVLGLKLLVHEALRSLASVLGLKRVTRSHGTHVAYGCPHTLVAYL
jgi:hypothetical protein